MKQVYKTMVLVLFLLLLVQTLPGFYAAAQEDTQKEAQEHIWINIWEVPKDAQVGGDDEIPEEDMTLSAQVDSGSLQGVSITNDEGLGYIFVSDRIIKDTITNTDIFRVPPIFGGQLSALEDPTPYNSDFLYVKPDEYNVTNTTDAMLTVGISWEIMSFDFTIGPGVSARFYQSGEALEHNRITLSSPREGAFAVEFTLYADDSPRPFKTIAITGVLMEGDATFSYDAGGIHLEGVKAFDAASYEEDDSGNPILLAQTLENQVNGADVFLDGMTCVICTPDLLPALSPPANCTFDAAIASWSAVNKAAGYLVVLLDEVGTQITRPIRTTQTSVDFTKDIILSGHGVYTFQVTPVGDCRNAYHGQAASGPAYQHGEDSPLAYYQSYTVIQPEHGTIAPSDGVFELRKWPTFQITADEGYEVEAVLLDKYYNVRMTDGSPVTTLNYQVSSAGRYECSTVQAILYPIPVFTDVPEEDWCYQDVKITWQHGIMTATSQMDFFPDEAMTRAMAVMTLFRLSGSPLAAADAAFSDVPDDAYYADAISWATEQEIVLGYPDGTFHPDEPVTREEMATFLARTYQSIGMQLYIYTELEYAPFDDLDSISDFAYYYVEWAANQGFLRGKDNGLLAPSDPITRAEAASVFCRYTAFLNG